MRLSAHPDVLFLHGQAGWDIDTERSQSFPVYLVDTAGNNLTDPSGNLLIAYIQQTFSPPLLHALPDDLFLNTEATNG